MHGLPLLDMLVIVVYFAMMIAIGVWCARRIKNQEDYFLAGRSFGKFIQTFAAFGQATSADTAVGTTTTTFTSGASGIWSGMTSLLSTPFYWLIAPWYRRSRLISLGDIFEERYRSPRLAMLYAILISISLMFLNGLGIAAMSKTILALTPKSQQELTQTERAEYSEASELKQLEDRDHASLTNDEQDRLTQLRIERPRAVFSHLNKGVLISVVCAVVIVYGISGGLFAAFITDTIQGLFIIVLSVAMLPFAWSKINALYGGETVFDAFRLLHAKLPESFFDVFGSSAAADFTWYYLAAVSVLTLLQGGVAPNMFVAVSSAKDEYTARFGFVSGNYMKRIATILWGLFALFALVLYGDAVRDPDMAWGIAALDLLGSLNMGLVGLMAACLMAALMSTADCMMITASGLLTHNVFRPLWPDLPERAYVLAGRASGAVVVIGGAIIAYQFASVFSIMKAFWEFSAMFYGAFWLGMTWRRGTRIAAWISILLTFMLMVLLPTLIPMAWPGVTTHPNLLVMTRSRTESRQYRATAADVAEREKRIAEWDASTKDPSRPAERPKEIAVGETFTQTFRVPSRSVFWTRGIKPDESGRPQGQGSLNLGLLALHRLGWDLSRNSYALNETLRIIIRIVFPFLVMLAVSWMTRHSPEDERALDRFFARMKTPVVSDREEDARQVALSHENPHRFDDRLLFPGTNWQFLKWHRVDAVGFGISVLAMFGVVIALLAVVRIGG